MKLQKSISRRIGGREYVKHQVVIPNNIITQAGWSPRDHIEARTTARGILLYKTEPMQSDKRLEYEQFKSTVVNALTTVPQGCTWSELRLKSGVEQKTPSPVWVRRMEAENSLQRARDQATSQIIWKLPLEYFASANLSTLNGWTGKSPKSLTPNRGSKEIEPPVEEIEKARTVVED